jgi:hypothetical protein
MVFILLELCLFFILVTAFFNIAVLLGGCMQLLTYYFYLSLKLVQLFFLFFFPVCFHKYIIINQLNHKNNKLSDNHNACFEHPTGRR